MTILIVDDQISVVSGLFFGIDWAKIGIDKVLKAYSAKEARDLFETWQIDIMLCDIEMPVEDGLSLFSYVREKQYDTECIFLTAHADFIYAKEAIALGSFDYILQPARYEDIQKAVERLIDKITVRRRKEEMAHCGDLIRNRKGIFLDAVVKRLFFDKDAAKEQAEYDLKKLGIHIEVNEKAYMAKIVLHDAEGVFADWENDLIRYAMNNILEEMFHYYGYGILLCCKTRKEYMVYIYRKEAAILETEIIKMQFIKFCEFYKDSYHCDANCYFTVCNGVYDSAGALVKLEELCENDVTREEAVVNGDEINEKVFGYEQIRRYFSEISLLLDNGLYEKISDDILEMIDRLAEEKRMDAGVLKRLYQDFSGIVNMAAIKYQKTLSDMFEDEEDRERSLKAYVSVEEMKWFVKYVMAWLNECSMSDEKQKTQIDCICQYIRSNMEHDIKRTDIAELVHLNPNYVSRLFKNQTGMSLKEYIMKEKMELARELVRNTNLPISVITMKTGYNNFSYFAQVYKKTHGFPPIEDREKNGKAK